ncbi:glycoside hydrolase family 2 protein [Fulvimonas yonginensis]|uniref:Beta-mannosidase B n=2 Tax=Fulvimonas yonginensis TaxID=1495200 RepID=A0ABU8JE01_9GAMM
MRPAPPASGARTGAKEGHLVRARDGQTSRTHTSAPARSCGIAALLLILLPALGHAAPLATRTLDSDWQFRLAPGDSHARAHPQAARWLPATVPGSVQTDLMAAGLVADPFVGTHEAQIQWVGLSDWVYRTTFEVDTSTLARRHVALVFDGLDTFAEVWLDGHRLLAADNMFRRWQADAKPWLHAGSNTLEVRLYSPIKRLQPWLQRQPYALPGAYDSAFGDEPKGRQTTPYVRKAAYQYGWDWGPRIVTEGIWQDVRLVSWDTLRVDALHATPSHVDRHAARVDVRLAVDADGRLPASLEVTTLGPDGRVVAKQEHSVEIAQGNGQVGVSVSIAEPQLWYPAGYGAQAMYTFEAVLRDSDGHVLYEGRRATGLRTVELRRDHDRWGRGFAFVVNGIPIFAKGANLVPFDSFPTRVTAARMRAVLQAARDANMNMLRVWGGGYYLPDAFYEDADRLGLMVWQDFMFGGSIPPYDRAFVANVRQEALEQVERLRDHPSLVLWCGNNEVQSSWASWGDRLALKRTLAPAERTRIEQGMRHLFGTVLREVVAHHDADVPYWPSSPSTGGDGMASALDEGDYHYWDVWSGEARPAEAYLDVTPRFQSEYGLQSMPSLQTIRDLAGRTDLRWDAPVLRAHQKFDGGNGTARLLDYVRRDYGEPKGLAAFVYLSQLMQAEGIGLAAEHLRAARPRAMGSLYWQLNDVWPAVSWSSIDVAGRWKALQFRARRFYAPLLVAALRHDGQTTVSLVSDRTGPLPARWRMRLMDVGGKVLADHDAQVTLPPLSSTEVARYGDAQLLGSADPHRTFAVFELLDGNAPASRALVFFAPPKDLHLPLPHLRAQLEPTADGYALTLSSDVLARAVWLSFDGLDAELSDNSLDLLPGERVTLTVHSRAPLAALRRALRVQDLAHVMTGGK